MRGPSRAAGSATAPRALGTAGLVLGGALLAGACEAPDVGQAEMLNESGRNDLSLVILVPDGDEASWSIREHVYFDIRVEGDIQCLLEQDGGFEVRDAEGAVLVRHEYADRPVCEHDVLVLGADGALSWAEVGPDAAEVVDGRG